MNSILAKLLRKRGISSLEVLDAEERATFDRYELILNKREISVADMRQFMQSRIDHIESKWADMNTDATKKAEYIPYHTVYKTLLKALDAPQAEREALEQVLLQQVS